MPTLMFRVFRVFRVGSRQTAARVFPPTGPSRWTSRSASPTPNARARRRADGRALGALRNRQRARRDHGRLGPDDQPLDWAGMQSETWGIARTRHYLPSEAIARGPRARYDHARQPARTARQRRRCPERQEDPWMANQLRSGRWRGRVLDQRNGKQVAPHTISAGRSPTRPDAKLSAPRTMLVTRCSGSPSAARPSASSGTSGRPRRSGHARASPPTCTTSSGHAPSSSASATGRSRRSTPPSSANG